MLVSMLLGPTAPVVSKSTRNQQLSGSRDRSGVRKLFMGNRSSIRSVAEPGTWALGQGPLIDANAVKAIYGDR